MNVSVYLAAFSLTLSLIIGIGPQNAFVLKQGIGRSYTGLIVVFCVVCDVLLIAGGVFGSGKLVAQYPSFICVLAWLGAAFMFWLAYKSWHAAWVVQKDNVALSLNRHVERDLKSVLRSLLIVCLLNPYSVFDTMVLIGGVSSVYGASNQASFIFGAVTASALWFTMLGVFASQLAPLFNKPLSWRILDAVVGAVMFAMGGMLIYRFGFQPF